MPIYTTPTRDRFFHIPADAALPPGDLHVRTTDGNDLHTTEAALGPYEITREAALPLLREEMRGAMRRLWQGLTSSGAPEPEPAPPPTSPSDLLHELTGLSLGDLLQRPEAVVEQLRTALAALRPILASPSDPAAAAQARSQLAALEATLAQHGYATDGRISTLPDRIARFARTPAGKRRLAKTLAQLDALLNAPNPRP
jgi:hypothetical protein